MTTNEIIRDLCHTNNVTIQNLEKTLGFSNASIAKANSNMKAEKLKAIADYFGVTMEYLMTGEDPAAREQHNYDISDFEYGIIKAFREADEFDQTTVLRTLHLDNAETAKKGDAAV